MKQYYLKSLSTQNFRNLSSEKAEFSSGINCIFGDNGNGKTNLLEAIYLITNKKSFRKSTSFAQFLSADHTKAEVLILSELSDESKNKIPYNYSFKQSGRELYIDGLKAKKAFNLNSVFINPFDSYQFHNSQTFRRDLIDNLMRDLYPDYKKFHNDYKKSLKFRNELLSKKPNQFLMQLDAIEKELSKNQIEVTKKREFFLNELNPYLSKTFKSIFDDDHLLNLELERNIGILDYDSLLEYYRSSRQKELILGRTGHGAHRDNYTFFFDGMNSFEYCSLGQQKMSYFSLIFAYIELFRYNNKGVYPVVLLDDVSGELDSKRWNNLINYLQLREFQVFITTANESFRTELEKIQNSKSLLVSEGSVIPQ